MAQQTRFLCVHQGYELYGSDRVFIQSVQAIHQSYPNAYITVHLPKMGALTDYIRPYASEIIFDDMIVLRRKNMNWKSIAVLPRMLVETYHRIRKFDIIYINTVTLLSYLLVSRFAKNRCIVHIHEIAKPFERIVFNILLWWSRSTIICNSKATQNALPITRKKSVLLYNGIKVINIEPTKTVHTPIRLLLIGRMNAWKGHSIAIKSMFYLKNKYPSSIMPHLRIVGSYFENQKHYYDSMVDLIAQYDLYNCVTIEPFTDTPDIHYEWADIVLVPSTRPEPFGLVALEAMNHGCAIIASNHGGLAEIVQNNKTGLLIPPNDVMQLVYAIEKYMNDYNMIVNHGLQGYYYLKEHFNQTIYQHNFIDILRANDPNFDPKKN